MNEKKPPTLYPSPSYFPSGLSEFEQVLDAEEKSKAEAEEKAQEIAALKKQLAFESSRVESLADTLHESRKAVDDQKAKIGRQSAIMTAGFIGMIFLGLFSPVRHRLSPDIGSEQDDSGRVGQVTGFHYQRSSWWGLSKKTFDRIRFDRNRGPQYLDDESAWQNIPPEAWGDHSGSEDDRTMEVDNRGWHEQ